MKRLFLATTVLIALALVSCWMPQNRTTSNPSPVKTVVTPLPPTPTPPPPPNVPVHKVIVSWTAESSVVGYNIYRSTTTGGPYGKIGNVTGLIFSDTLVFGGNTYFYVVTSVNSNNDESGYSNEVKAVIPTP